MTKAEKFIQDYTTGCSNELEGGVYHEWLTPEQARAAVRIEREELIEKAWEWVEDNVLSINQQDQSRLYFEQFKSHMEGE